MLFRSKNLKPQFVVHTIAHPSVDFCENNREISNKLHVETTRNIVDVCAEQNSKLIYLSTDAVFDGKQSCKYQETDEPNPVNYYGKTKLMAEHLVSNSPKNVVLRTAVIYGWHKRSRFTNWIIESLREKKSVDPFIDQYNTPTLVDDLASAIIKIIKIGRAHV